MKNQKKEQINGTYQLLTLPNKNIQSQTQLPQLQQGTNLGLISKSELNNFKSEQKLSSNLEIQYHIPSTEIQLSKQREIKQQYLSDFFEKDRGSKTVQPKKFINQQNLNSSVKNTENKIINFDNDIFKLRRTTYQNPKQSEQNRYAVQKDKGLMYLNKMMESKESQFKEEQIQQIETQYGRNSLKRHSLNPKKNNINGKPDSSNKNQFNTLHTNNTGSEYIQQAQEENEFEVQIFNLNQKNIRLQQEIEMLKSQIKKKQSSQIQKNTIKSYKGNTIELVGEKLKVPDPKPIDIDQIRIQHNQELQQLQQKINLLEQKNVQLQTDNKKKVEEINSLQNEKKNLSQKIEQMNTISLQNQQKDEENEQKQEDETIGKENNDDNNKCEDHLQQIYYYKQLSESLKSKLYYTEKDLEELNEKYEEIIEKIDKLKNKENLNLVKRKWTYEIVSIEVLENLERLNREKEMKLNFNISKLAESEQKNKNLELDIEKLQELVSDLRYEIEILKGKGRFSSMFTDMNTKNFRDIGQEIMQLKKTIDGNIQNMPQQEKILNLEVQLERVVKMNNQMEKKLIEIEEKQQKEQKQYNEHEILQKLEETEIKLKQNLQCVQCLDMPTKPVTCIPCGHSYCKSCYYKAKQYKQSNNQSKNEEETKDPDNPFCKQCGKDSVVNYVYRNDYIKDMIEMYSLLKTSKDIVKLYMTKVY